MVTKLSQKVSAYGLLLFFVGGISSRYVLGVGLRGSITHPTDVRGGYRHVISKFNFF